MKPQASREKKNKFKRDIEKYIKEITMITRERATKESFSHGMEVLQQRKL